MSTHDLIDILIWLSPILFCFIPIYILSRIVINRYFRGLIYEFANNFSVLLALPAFAIGFGFVLNKDSEFVIVPGVILYSLLIIYFVYLTFNFTKRLIHYYRLPNLNEKHRRVGGGIDIHAAQRDAPIIAVVQNQPAWESRNQELRAAQALHGLTGKGHRPGRPEFNPQPVSKIDAANEVVKAYTSYLWAATGAYITQREKEIVEEGRKHQSL